MKNKLYYKQESKKSQKRELKSYENLSELEIKKEIKKIEKKMTLLIESANIKEAKEIKKEWELLKKKLAHK